MREFTINDKVKISSLYQSNYPLWKIKGKEGIIKNIKKYILKADTLNKDSKDLFKNEYGVQEEYTLYELGVVFDDDTKTYCVSQFGVSE